MGFRVWGPMALDSVCSHHRVPQIDPKVKMIWIIIPAPTRGQLGCWGLGFGQVDISQKPRRREVVSTPSENSPKPGSTVFSRFEAPDTPQLGPRFFFWHGWHCT